MNRIVLLALACCATSAVLAADPTPAAVAAVEELGRVNGTALACNQPALSSRARNAMVTGAPKTRQYGEMFENATNATFLSQGRGGACPDAATLSQELDQAEKRLQSAFPPVK